MMWKRVCKKEYTFVTFVSAFLLSERVSHTHLCIKFIDSSKDILYADNVILWISKLYSCVSVRW